LFDELDALRDGKSHPQRANAFAKTACQIFSSVKIELEHAKFLALVDKSGNQQKQLPLIDLGESKTN